MKVRGGFTLINLILIFAVITVLSAILFPRFCQGTDIASGQVTAQEQAAPTPADDPNNF